MNPQEPPDAFYVMLDNTLAEFNHFAQGDTEFLVLAIQQPDGHTGVWGVIDLRTVPEEDVYTEICRRATGAFMVLGGERVAAVGLYDIRALLQRAPLPKPRPPLQT